MPEPPPQRVRVTGPPRHVSAGRPGDRIGDVHEQTELGDVLLRSLLREQLARAAGVLAILGATLGVLPLVFHLWPGLAATEVAGLPLAWLLLGVVVYPLLMLLGWRYVRGAERNERAFADLVGSGSGAGEVEGEQ